MRSPENIPGPTAPESRSRFANYFFMRPILRRMREGVFVYLIVSVVLRVIAALMVPASLAAFFQAGKVIFGLPTTGAIFGGILYQLFYVLAIYAVVHVFLIRASDIRTMQPGEVYMLPLGAMLMRMLGEAYAAFVALVAMGGGFFVWFTSKKAAAIMGPLATFFPSMRDATFIGGIEFMLTGLLLSVGAVIGSYMLAEIIMLFGMAGNARSATSALPGPRPVAGRSGSLRSRVSHTNGNGNGQSF